MFDTKTLKPGLSELTADHAGAVVSFRTRHGEQVQARVASSFISPEQAERNLQEIGTNNFEAVKQQGQAAWNQALGRVEIAGGTDEQQRTFYSCLYRARETMSRLYRPTPDGYCGDEDNGQTSAWYVFSALGFYPVCPASDQYVLGAPLFPQATLHLPGGHDVVLNAPANNAANRYVNQLTMNGQPYPHNWLSHSELLKGATLNFEMSAAPNKARGTQPADAPYSFSKPK